MLINIIGLDGNTKQHYNAKKVYEWVIKKKLKDGIIEEYEVYLVYNDNGSLLGFGWKDEIPNSIDFILELIKSENISKFVPLTVKEYRQRKNDYKKLKVSKNKSNSYSLYFPTTWMREFLSDDMYVDVVYKGDCIIIRKSEIIQNDISE